MNKNFTGIFPLFLIFLSLACNAQTKTNATGDNTIVTSSTFGKATNFLIVSDYGWNGEKYQQVVANQMAKTADSVDAKFITTCGDNFQIAGVASTLDPLWKSCFEDVYKAQSLQVEWYPVLGNHDYKGSTQAQLDYSKISRRWRMTDRYYTMAKKVNDSVSVRLIFLDTPPLVASYRNNPTGYPDAVKQDTDKEIKWLNDVLANAKEQWIMVFGHHPVYSASKTHGNTPEMIERVKPLLDKYHVQFYFCGHDHDFQRLNEKGSKVDYIVTGTGGEVRPSSMNDMSLFSKSEPGFSVVSLKGDKARICFVGVKGNIIYDFSRSYK